MVKVVRRSLAVVAQQRIARIGGRRIHRVARGSIGVARGSIGVARGSIGVARGSIGVARGSVGIARSVDRYHIAARGVRGAADDVEPPVRRDVRHSPADVGPVDAAIDVIDGAIVNRAHVRLDGDVERRPSVRRDIGAAVAATGTIDGTIDRSITVDRCIARSAAAASAGARVGPSRVAARRASRDRPTCRNRRRRPARMCRCHRRRSQ